MKDLILWCYLSATIASYLFERTSNEEEGFLTRMWTKLVCGEMLGSLGLKMGISEYVIMSRHVEIDVMVEQV